MPVRAAHDVAHLGDIVGRYAFVKEIAHGVHEDLSRPSPSQGLIQLLRYQAKIEVLLEWMIGNASETLREGLGVTELTAGTDLRAAPYGVPRGIRPFNCRVIAHIAPDQG